MATGSTAVGTAGIQALYEKLISAWNQRSADGFAACFLKEGNAIGFDGTQMDGAEKISESLKGVFDNHPTARYVTIVREVRTLSDQVALLRAVAGMVPPNSREIKAEVNAIQSLVAQWKEGEWKIALFQNTPAAFHGRPESANALTKELQAAFDRQ